MLEFILQPEIFTAIVSILALVIVAVLGWKGRKFITHGRIVFQVWHLIEKAGALKDWKGYEKLAMAMGVFRDRFQKEFGKEPSPTEEGWAVKVLTWLCNIEDKEDVEDFLEQ
jgi:hypothetical protein